MLTDRKLLGVPVILVKGEAVSLLDVKLKVRQFFVTRYPTDVKESPAVAPE